MKNILFFTTLLISSLGWALPTHCPAYQVCFSPNHQCTGSIITMIDSAKHSILVQAYSFTSYQIAKALVAAQQRGVDVKLILDKSWLKDISNSTSILYMYKKDIPIWIDYLPAIAHSKVMIIDKQTVITGSFNFTNAADRSNVENLLIVNDTSLAALYAGNWQERQAASVKLPSFQDRKAFERVAHKLIAD